MGALGDQPVSAMFVDVIVSLEVVERVGVREMRTRAGFSCFELSLYS